MNEWIVVNIVNWIKQNKLKIKLNEFNWMNCCEEWILNEWMNCGELIDAYCGPRIIGSAISWILEGLLKDMPTSTPFKSSGFLKDS